MVTREGRPLWAALAVALVAAILAGCGGSSSDSSSSEATTASPTTATTAKENGEKNQGAHANNKGGAQGQGKGPSKGQEQQGGSGSKKHAVAPLQVSGGGSGQFRVKGGDNSIQEYGDESGESELQEVAEIVHGFYVARAAGEWGAACSSLAKRNVEQLEKLTTKSGCSAALAAFTEPLSPQLEREITTVDAGSFRHEGTQGFLIYYGAGRTVYSMPMFEEGGAWKVAALIGTALS